MAADGDGTDDLVPEDFDLEQAHRKPSVTDDGKRKKCPECGSVSIRKAVLPPTRKDAGHDSMRGNPSGKRGGYADPAGRYSCDACDHRFDDPDVDSR